MSLTAHEIEDILDRQFKESGLSEFVSREHSQFLDVLDEPFVEIVLTDGSRINDAGKIVHDVRQELKAQGVNLDSVVRALWKVVGVAYVGMSKTSDNQLRAAHAFSVTLQSGKRSHYITVDVFWGAVEFLQEKLGLKSFVPTNQAGHLTGEMVANAVHRFVEHQLSMGGMSYWDPIRFPRLELNDSAMLFLMGQSTSFNELRQAISDAFDPPVLESFLKGLEISEAKLSDFEALLPEFSNMLGGAYRRASTFSTSAVELFEKMDRIEQELLKKYFYARVELLRKNSPELVRQFAKVFA